MLMIATPNPLRAACAPQVAAADAPQQHAPPGGAVRSAGDQERRDQVGPSRLDQDGLLSPGWQPFAGGATAGLRRVSWCAH